MSQKNEKVSRRSFLRSTSAGAAALGLGTMAGCATTRRRGPTAASVVRVIGANDRIIFGSIGVGGQGGGHVRRLVEKEKSDDKSKLDNVKLVAVSDCYRKRIDDRAALCEGKGYGDYRELLDRNDIDAVVIATPDHWHFKTAIDAIDAGKHVYVEKPMVHTTEQAIALRDKVRRTKRVLQVGPQGTGSAAYWAAHDLIRQGVIGKVLWAEASYCRNNPNGEWNWTIDEGAGPNGSGKNHIDWDTWLGYRCGCAPKVAWDPERFFRFRKFWDYSGGIATDLLYHKLAPLLIAIAGPDGEYPRRVSAGGGIYVQKDTREVPDTFFVTLDYPSEFSVVLTSSMANTVGSPELVRGNHATINMGSGQIEVQEPYKDEFHKHSDGQDSIKIDPKDWNDRRGDHMRNFIDAVRGLDRLNCNVELGAATQVAITMGVMAYRTGKTLYWDAKRERVV